MIYNVNLKKVLSHLRQSAKKRNLKFNLTLCDLEDLSYPITCPILDIPIDYESRGYGEFKPSIDRIDSDMGYEQGNIQVMTVKANRMKSNASLDELIQFSKFYK